MDTSVEAGIATDALGRRTGPRRQYTIEEKRRIVEETHRRGASVATVARRHELNPNQVFMWRQQFRQGLLDPKCAQANPSLLPVEVSTPTVLPSGAGVQRVSMKLPIAERACGSIEIELANGHRLHVRGLVDAKALGRVIDVLVRR